MNDLLTPTIRPFESSHNAARATPEPPRAAAGFEVRGDVAEALDLLLLCCEIRNDIEDEIDQRKLPRHRHGRKVAGHSGNRFGAGLGPELSNHVG